MLSKFFKFKPGSFFFAALAKALNLSLALSLLLSICLSLFLGNLELITIGYPIPNNKKSGTKKRNQQPAQFPSNLTISKLRPTPHKALRCPVDFKIFVRSSSLFFLCLNGGNCQDKEKISRISVDFDYFKNEALRTYDCRNYSIYCVQSPS